MSIMTIIEDIQCKLLVHFVSFPKVTEIQSEWLLSVKLDKKLKKLYYLYKTETHWNLGMAYEILAPWEEMRIII